MPGAPGADSLRPRRVGVRRDIGPRAQYSFLSHASTLRPRFGPVVTEPADHLRYAAVLARTVDILRRSAEPGAPQKAALQALVDAAAERSVTIRFYDGVLTIDSLAIATTDPRMAVFVERLAAQNVAEIAVARGADATELLALARGLASDPGHGRLKERLRDASSTRVMVVSSSPSVGERKPVTVSGAFEKVKMDEEVMEEWNRFLDHGAKTAAGAEQTVDLGLRERATGEVQVDVGLTPSAPATPPAAPPPPRAPTPREPAAPEPRPSGLSQPPTLQAASTLGVALARLVGDPYSADVLSRLTLLARQVQDAFTHDQVAEAIDACHALIELEAGAKDPARGSYGVIIKRVLNRSALAQVAPYLLEPRRRERATTILRRGGEDAVGLLMGLMAAAEHAPERVIYLDVLRGVSTGVDRVLALLSRPEWQVVRNVAEAVGEAQVLEAVPYLARLTEHSDDRVVRAAIVALAKIGSGGAIEPLRNVLQRATPELKALVAANIGGAQARPLVAPLATLAADEENPDVIRAYYKAIGRIGTPEAKQVLENAAARKTIFSRRGKVAREAAEDALRQFPS